MRIDVTERRAKDMAKALKKALPQAAGLSYQQCLDLVATALGEKSYQHLQPRLAATPAGTDPRPDLARADDRDLIEELERRGKVPLAFLPELPYTFGLRDHCRAWAMETARQLLSEPDADWPAAPYVQADARAAQAAIQKVIEGAEREVYNVEVAPEADEPRVRIEHLNVTLFDVWPAPETCLDLARRIKQADSHVQEVRFRLNRTPLVEAPLVVEPRADGERLDPLSLSDSAIGSYLKAERGGDCLRELKDFANEQGGDGTAPIVLTVVGDLALIFPEGDPERAPQREGVRVGLVIPKSATRRGRIQSGYTNALKGLLVRKFAAYLPHDPACDTPDHSRRILAHFGEGCAPRLFGHTIDVTDDVLNPASGTIEEKRRFLAGGKMRYHLPGTPGDKLYDVAVRGQAEAFFGKPVERLTEADLARARQARG